jgi:hypothetical protein
VVDHTYHPSNSKKHKIGGIQSRPAWAKVRPYLKDDQRKSGWRCEALNPKPRIQRERERERERENMT